MFFKGRTGESMVEMVRTVAESQLPVDETLRIRKMRYIGTPASEDAHLPRISIVTGIHGDELEGQYVAYELGKIIREQSEKLTGIVDIYPAMNPLGIDCIMRGIPGFDLDMNRTFPGYANGNMFEYLGSQIIKDVMGSDLVMDIHSSNIFLTEIPQIRINVLQKKELLPYAEAANVDLLWVHEDSPALRSTFAYSLNSRGTKTLVVEMGVGMRITKRLGKQLLDGIFNVMVKMGVWQGAQPENIRTPIIADDPRRVEFLNAPVSGIFIKDLDVGTHVRAGDRIGRVVDPLEGKMKAFIASPCEGLLFTTREYPVVNEGSLMGRILRDKA